MASVLDAFTSGGRWFKGNLHLHTTMSDGRLAPAEAAALYRDAGYDFLAITDHWHRTDVAALGADKRFLLVPGEEVNGFDPVTDMIWHIVGLFTEREIARPVDKVGAQWGIDQVLAAGGDAVFAHPYWSGDLVSEMLDLKGLTAVEVFNTTCQRAHGRGHSLFHWDALWHRGRRLWGTAVDDSHHGTYDGLQGWVKVKAPELSLAAVRAALKAGHFYASTGPDIDAIELNGRQISVRCSPCEAIYCQSNRWMGRAVYASKDFRGPGEPLTGATFALNDEATYVRITCTDAKGNSAWSNPVALA